MIYAHTQHGQAHAQKTSADTYNAILIRIEGVEGSILNSPNVKAVFLNCGTIQKNKKGYAYTTELNGVVSTGECKTIKEAIAACVAAFIAIENQCNTVAPNSADIEAADADAQAAEQVAAESTPAPVVVPTPAKIVVGKQDGTAQITTADGVTTVAPRRDVTISEVNAAHDALTQTPEHALIQSLMGRDYSERYRAAYAAYIATPQYKTWASLLDAYNAQQAPADIGDLIACEQAREAHDAYFAQLAEQGEPPVSEEPQPRISLILDGFRCRRRLIQHNANRERITPLQWANNAVLAHRNGGAVLLHSLDLKTPLLCYITRHVASVDSNGKAKLCIELTQVSTYQQQAADYAADQY